MLALPSEDRTAGAFTFTVTKLTATEARKVQLILAKVLGPALGALGNTGLNEGAISQALESAAASLNDQDMKTVVDLLGKSSRVHLEDGKTPLVKDVYELFFANHGMLLHWKWIAAALSYNFSDFLEGLDGLDLGGALGALKK